MALSERSDCPYGMLHENLPWLKLPVNAIAYLSVRVS